MKADILKILHKAGGFVSGEEISALLHVSRASVWKHIKALKEDGCEIEAHTNKGYRLVRIPDLLKSEYINLSLAQPADIVWFAETDSTNTQGKLLARQRESDFFVVVAEHQSGGKGRLGRAWASNPGEAVQMSFVCRPDLPPGRAPAMNFAVALGVSDAIFEEVGIKTGVKWPNDVVYGAKKICGILTEMSADMDKVEFLVCGAGINANQRRFSGEISGRAISLRMIKGGRIDRVRLAAALVRQVKRWMGAYIAGGMDALMPAYRERSVVLGREITVSDGQASWQGVCAGFGGNGEIRVKIGEEERSFHAGEVSVRGRDQYV